MPPVRALIEDYLPVSGIALEVLLAMLAAPFLAVATAFGAVLATVFYVDQRVRCEGLDLRLKLESMKSRSALVEGIP